jgi:hypothetical protein
LTLQLQELLLRRRRERLTALVLLVALVAVLPMPLCAKAEGMVSRRRKCRNNDKMK